MLPGISKCTGIGSAGSVTMRPSHPAADAMRSAPGRGERR
jgi:hypothetical protein